ncbi:unnamed protein product, partial [Brassica oleracea]
CPVAFHFNDVSPGPAESELRFWLIQLWDGSLEPGEGGLGSCFERIGISFDIFFVFSFTILWASVTASDGKTEKYNGTEGESQKAEPEKKGGRGRKRKAATQMKAKKVVAAMLYSIDCAVEMRWVDIYFPFTELSSLIYIFKKDNAKAVGIPVKELKVFSKIF